jgi:myo-inositol-1(or 4)-monophosphatase
MHPMLNIAVRAARTAGNIITRGFENRDDLHIDQKGANDFVTKIDREAEAAIISKIQQSYPDHSFLGEEGGTIEADPDHQWIIDPLDGTTNFIQGIPHFAVSIALKIKGKLEIAVVFDPIRGDLFTATKGQGAQLNNFRIRCGKRNELSEAIIATAFPFRDKARIADYMKKFTPILVHSGDIRRSGSAALDLAYVASGKYDGYFEANLKPWDIAAGLLLVREAGGITTDFNGGDNVMASGDVVSGNPKVVQKLLKHLK